MASRVASGQARAAAPATGLPPVSPAPLKQVEAGPNALAPDERIIGRAEAGNHGRSKRPTPDERRPDTPTHPSLFPSMSLSRWGGRWKGRDTHPPLSVQQAAAGSPRDAFTITFSLIPPSLPPSLHRVASSLSCLWTLDIQCLLSCQYHRLWDGSLVQNCPVNKAAKAEIYLRMRRR